MSDVMFIFASRDILKGEELCIDYVSNEETVGRRQEILAFHGITEKL